MEHFAGLVSAGMSIEAVTLCNVRARDVHMSMHAAAHFEGSRRIASCFGSSKLSRSTGSAAPTSPKRVFSACVIASLKRRAVTLVLPSSDVLPRKEGWITHCEAGE